MSGIDPRRRFRSRDDVALGRFFALAGLYAAVLAGPLYAHPLAPSLLELRERASHRVEVLWKISVLNPQAAALEPFLPPRCRTLGVGWDGAAAERQGSGWVRRWTADCGAQGLDGLRIGINGLERVDTTVLVRVVAADGRTAQGVLDPESRVFIVPRRAAHLELAGSYLKLGFEHILGGHDHLLFVLGLLFLVRGRRRLLLTVTAFTLGHSVTLSLAALGAVRLPPAPVELAIALSIWIVALEVSRSGHAQKPHPWRMATIFGLLHGLGFAGALAEAGLPQGEIPLALLAFNLGIELGQVLFIAIVLALVAIVGRLSIPTLGGPRRFERRLALPAAYLIGTSSWYWLLQRGTDLLTTFA